MKDAEIRELRRRFARQHGLVSRGDLRALGIDAAAEQRRVAAGDWERLGRRVIRLVGAPPSPYQAILAACFEAGVGAFASHASAAWLWGLGPLPPRHTVTVPRGARASVAWADVHQVRDAPPAPSVRAGVPCTNPMRTMVDLAATVSESAVEDAMDRGLAARLLTVEGLVAELDRLSRPGRPGVRPMRRALARRGYLGAPDPSVLEGKFLRLLRQHRIEPLGVEVTIDAQGRYRIDAAVSEDVLAEVDGYAYHHTPEQKTEDERRRNRIRLTGKLLLVYTWRDVVHDGTRVIEEIRQALRLSWLRRAETRASGDKKRGVRRASGRQLTGAALRPPVL